MNRLLLDAAHTLADLLLRARVRLELVAYGVGTPTPYCPSCAVFYGSLEHPLHVGH